MATRRAAQHKYCEGWINAQICEPGLYQRYYAQLRSRELYLFENDVSARNLSNVSEKISLANVQSVTKDRRRGPNVLPTISIVFNDSTKEIRIRAGVEDQEKWFRYLFVVSLFQLPQDTNHLLPGQKQELLDLIKKEQQKTQREVGYITMQSIPENGTRPPQNTGRRVSSNVAPPLAPKPQEMKPSPVPASPSHRKSWFFDEILTREVAEEILTTNAEFGNLIMRKRSLTDPQDPYAYAISVKLPDSVFKHYRVKKDVSSDGSSTYVIFLSNKAPPPLPTLDDVIAYVVGECLGTLVPMSEVRYLPPTHAYETALPQKSTWASNRSTSLCVSEQENEATYLNETNGMMGEYHNVTNDVRSSAASSNGGLRGSHPPLLPRYATSPNLPTPPIQGVRNRP